MPTAPLPGDRASGIRRRDDYHKGMDAGSLELSTRNHLKYSLAKDPRAATAFDRYWSVCLAVRDRLVDRWMATQRTYYATDAKRVYYLSMEYLPGRTLRNALTNLGLEDEFLRASRDLGYPVEDLLEIEPDAGLGNGGLGRLASCFLDSMATLQLPGMGYGLRYEFGMFRQTLVDGWQREEVDHWLGQGNAWEVQRPERTYEIGYYGRVEDDRDARGRPRRRWVETAPLYATAFDVPIPGFRNNTVNTLRLWSARSAVAFDLDFFNSGDYIRAVERRARSENITRILYPNDKIFAGQELRLRQEFFLVSSSLQDIVWRFKSAHDDFRAFPDKVAIQINDTHPAMAVAELMRLLIDVERLEWEQAWEVVVATFGYTNHTLMPEALETWPVSLVGHVLPRHMEIIYEINHRFLQQVRKRWPGDADRVKRLSFIDEEGERRVRMASLAVVGSHSVNGVSALHTRLLRSRLFQDLAELHPDRFNSKTNGITPRRWLFSCNPDLTALITRSLGEGWKTDLDRLEQLRSASDDAGFRADWRRVKKANKEKVLRLVAAHAGVQGPPDGLLDVQVKRIHEYKRQLMNILRVVDSWRRAREGADLFPRTVVLGGKAAPGYTMAKLIIKLATSVAATINADPKTRDRLQLAFLPDYRVSLAEVLIPGAELSEQISTAGMEASGTGNMKFALNGAITIGTLDGANVEIKEAVGDDNIFIFGVNAKEAGTLQNGAGYDPRREIAASPRLKAALDLVAGGAFSPDDRTRFAPLVEAVTGRDFFLIARDFESYLAAQDRVEEAYRDGTRWARMSIVNTSGMGRFSSDRTIREYAEEIWKVRPVPVRLE